MPRKASIPDRPKLAPVSFRTTEQRRQQLEDKARAAGRSLSQEVERLLDLATDIEEGLGDPDLIKAMNFIGQSAGQMLRESGGSLANPRTRARVIRSILAATNLYLPSIALRKTNPDLAEALDMMAVVLQYSIPDFAPSAIYSLADGRPVSENEIQKLLVGIEALRGIKFSNATPEQVQRMVEKFKAKLAEAQLAAEEIQRSILQLEDQPMPLRGMLERQDRWNKEMSSRLDPADAIIVDAIAPRRKPRSKPEK